MRTLLRWSAALCLAMAVLAQPAAGAGYPAKPVSVIVPYGPGGATDIVARVLCEQLSKRFGQNFLVVNKVGAFGILAMQELVRNKPDGYTLFVSNVSVSAITPELFAKKLTFNYEAEIKPVTRLVSLPGVLVASTVDFAPKTVQEVIDDAKQHPGKRRYGSVGLGSYPQFDTELFARRAGISLVHVPMKGGASDMINGLATGDVQLGFLNVASAEGMVKAGRLRPLAVVSATELGQYPGTPTMAEVGFAGIGTEQWQALYVRAGTPAEIVDLLFQAVTEVMNSDETAQAFRSNGVNVTLSASPAAAAEWQAAEQRKWHAMVEETHIGVE